MINIDDNNNIIVKEEYKAILVGVSTGEDISYSMEELKSLAEASGATVIGEMIQNVDRINAGTFIGSGKLNELAEMCKNMEADLVIFNDELSGMQIRNIEDVAEVRIIDRTMLILDIFASRAISREGKLQVELAQLQYRMPRLLGFGKSLSRLGGGIGTRGPGEKKLETDRRHIQKRMDEIKKEMEEVKANRSVQRAKREKSDIPVAALVGYTNAGKSSIMNALVKDKQVFEKDMLFATLDTASRLIEMDDGKKFILIDTVGFVSKLPHALVNAFKATLEEVVNADLLIHVVDASFENHDFQIEVTEKVLGELKADSKDSILVFNKIDKIDNFNSFGKDSYNISAKTGEGMQELKEAIVKRLFSDFEVCTLMIPYERGDIVSYINDKAKPLETKYEEQGTLIKVELDAADRNRLCQYFIKQ